MTSESHDGGGPPAPIYNMIHRVVSPHQYGDQDDVSCLTYQEKKKEEEEEVVEQDGKREQNELVHKVDYNTNQHNNDHEHEHEKSMDNDLDPMKNLTHDMNSTTLNVNNVVQSNIEDDASISISNIHSTNGYNKHNGKSDDTTYNHANQSSVQPANKLPLSSTKKHQPQTINIQKETKIQRKHASVESFFTLNTATVKEKDPPARERPKDDKWPERDSLSFTRSLVFYGTGSITDEHEKACKYIMEARMMRKKYHGSRGTKVVHYLEDDSKCYDNYDEKKLEDILKNQCNATNVRYEFNRDGVVEVYIQEVEGANSNNGGRSKSLITVPSIDEFINDYNRLEYICSNGAMRTFCFQRLQMLHSAFKMHVTANSIVENEEQSNLLGTDFYRTMKIDNHIHLAAAPSAKQFVSFVGDKLANEGDTVVMENGQTLTEVFETAGLSADHMTIDAFNVLADYSVYQRFDNFNSKYSPFRLGEVRKIFLKVENIIEGRYFAELTKNVLARLEQSKGHNSAAEMRLSIYGMERGEWLNLAQWVLRDWGGQLPGPVLSTHNRWIIQVPRLWRIYCMKGKDNKNETCTKSFQDMMENLFCPIFEATLYPEKHPEIAELLENIVGFDSVDDEGTLEAPGSSTRPSEWQSKQNPAYCWQLYYLWANIEVLNKIRKGKGMNTFAFRPHAGETGDVMHLAATYMLATSINHGINLEHQVSLQYLYYLDQVGLSISPLSNNFLFKKINENPFPKLFKRGLNVTLSTDDPLLFHMSDDALLEEYSVARASFDLSMTDISEIARNSILQSGFDDDFKKKHLGEEYKRGITFCDEMKTHVPLIRAKFRGEHLALEHMLVNLIAAGKGEEVLRQMMIHFGHARNAHRNILFQHLPDVSFPEQNQL